MKISAENLHVNLHHELLACFDVSRRSLNLFTRFEQADRTYRIEDEIANSTDAIEHILTRLSGIVAEADLEHLRVLCEPTGGYEQKLLRTAQRLGHYTALISSEHVAQLKKVESNDTGKTDLKDPRVMHLVARLGKMQKHRHLPECYRRLRRLTEYYDDDDLALSAVRSRFLALLRDLFPDYDKSAIFTFDNTGSAMMEAYGFSPYRIVRAGYSRFERKMKRHVRWVRFTTLEHLFHCAQQSVRYAHSEAEVTLLEERAAVLWSDYDRHTQRMTQLRGQIEEAGRQLKRTGKMPRLDEDIKGLTLFNMSRLLGQTGPLKDFPSKRALLRYAGLNIRERKSGTYRGQNRISKKGRALLRKVLGQTVFPLQRRIHLYGPYYHSKLESGMNARKAKVAVMRKFLILVHAVALSGERFDPVRFGTCASQYRPAA